MLDLIARLCRGLLLACSIAGTAVAAPPTSEVLRVAVHLDSMKDTSRADVETSLKVWAEEMKQVLEVPAEISFYQSISEMRRDLAGDRINFVIADALELLRHFDAGDLSEGFGGTRDIEGMVLLKRRDGSTRGIQDLPGKRLLLQSGSEISGLMMDTVCLRKLHKSCRSAGVLLGSESRSHQMILQLFFGKADVALVRNHSYQTAIELNPQIRQQLEVLERFPIYPSALGLFGSRVSPAFREYVIGKAPLMDHYPRGRQILEVLQTPKIGRYPLTILDPVRDLVREHESLSDQYTKRKAQR